jgi:lathosterol oxidase
MASRSGVLGWVTGVVSTVLGALAFGAVLCLWFPAVLTTPALRDVYPMDVVRTTIKVALGVAFVLGVVSGLLERRKALGLTGAGLALLATLMGGSEVAVATPVARSSHVGLDWFLLDLFLLSAIFVPIELLWARLDQPVFRDEWRTDLWHFGVSHLLVQLTVFLTMAPAAIFFRWAVAPELQAAVAGQPYALQLVEVLVVADLTQYTVHRLFHAVPWLAISSAFQPPPMPKSTRPPDSRSRVAISFAVTMGSRSITRQMPVPRRSRLVAPAADMRATKGS